MAPFGGFCVVMTLFAADVLADGEVATVFAAGGFIVEVLAAEFAGLLAAILEAEFDIEFVVFDAMFEVEFDIVFVEFVLFAAVFDLLVFETLVAAPPHANVNAIEVMRVNKSRILVVILIISLAIWRYFYCHLRIV